MAHKMASQQEIHPQSIKRANIRAVELQSINDKKSVATVDYPDKFGRSLLPSFQSSKVIQIRLFNN
jgi:hypothetical protein